jgi:hypothetical protein
MGLKGALLILLRSSKIKIKSLPPSGLSATFPRFAGEGTAVVAARLKLVLSLPPLTGEAAPNGAEGGALDLALKCEDQDQERT